MASIQQTNAQSNKTAVYYEVSNFTPESSTYTETKTIQTPSTFLTLSQFIHYTLENGNKIRVKLCSSW